MNEDGDQQDGELAVMEQIDSAQKMLDNLKKMLAEKKGKAPEILTSIKERIDTLCNDVEKNVVNGTTTNGDVDSATTSVDTAQETLNSDKEQDGLHPIIKTETSANNLIGTIKIKNLSSLLEPIRKPELKIDESLIVLSSSEDDLPISTRSLLNKNKTKSKNDQTSNSPKSNKIKSNCKIKRNPKRQIVIVSASSDESDKVSDSMQSPRTSPTKSILKDPLNKTFSPDKRVNFSNKKAEVHTYASNIPSSTSESEQSTSDEEFTVKPLAKKKKLRIKIKLGDEASTSRDYTDDIRQDKKYFSKCVVNVPGIPSGKLLGLLDNEDENNSDDENLKSAEADKMDGLKRKRSQRHQREKEVASSDSDAKPLKKHKKHSRKEEKILSGDDSDNEISHSKLRNKEKKHKDKKDKERHVKNGASKKPQEPEPDEDKEEEVEVEEVPVVEDTNEEDVDEAPEVPSFASEVEVAGNDENDEEIEIPENNMNGKGSEESNRSDTDEEVTTKKNKKKKDKKKTKPKAKRVLSDSDESAELGSEDSSGSSAEESEKEETPKKSKTNKRSRIKKVADSSTDEEDDKTTRKQIRKVIGRESLAETTKQAEKDEADRKARIAERQEKYNNIFDAEQLENSQLSKVVLDFNEETQEELLSVDKDLVKHLKPHQGKGIQFMWNACFESLDRAQNTDGSGCILAHCMGLGKTLQVIALTHTLLAGSDKTGVRKVLVVCPLSTVLNWVAEYKKWLPDDDEVQVYNLVSFKQNRERACHTMDWHKHGGVLILGYDMFRNLSNETNKRMSKKMRSDFQTALVNPGADLVVCDEGHLLKNEKTSLSKAMTRIRSSRRIVLTGTPLQNNLKEYYCMVQFVKANLLGTYKEYLNRFVNPITNGQYTDSTQLDIIVMRKRSHVLHKLLDGIVQRRDYAVLAPFLPPKHEYVIFISLTETQRNLYRHYLVNFAQRSGSGRTSFLFTDFQELQRICTHPRVLLDKSILNRIAQEKKDWENDDESEGSLKDFVDDSDEESDAKSTSSGSGDGSDAKNGKADSSKNVPGRRKTRAMAEADSEPEVEETVSAPTEWWSQFTAGDELDNIIHSGKLTLLFEILHECELIGDKVLVFSQSLLSLNVIEYFLSKIDDAAQSGDSGMVRGYSSSWSLGLDYYRLDGSSSCDNRADWCKTFNDPENTRARLFLISTRAGGLGINLVGANRVIIFDVSWNPSHDIQSIYRVYRFGQIKPSFIYRFVTLGTMEMKVYERQVTKQAISKRVIDEQQIDRHYNQNDLQELYKFEPEPEDRPLPAPPKDILLGELLQNFKELVFKYHEHQSLLENKEDEVLNEAERKAAWEEFENEKTHQRNATGSINNIPMHTVVQALSSIIKREHPGCTALEISGVMPQLITELRGQLANGEMAIFNKMCEEIRSIKAAEQARVKEYYQQQQALWMMQQMQKQFPGLNPADAEKILRSQMTNFTNMNFPMNATGSSTAATPAPRVTATPMVTNPDEVVNLDED